MCALYWQSLSSIIPPGEAALLNRKRNHWISNTFASVTCYSLHGACNRRVTNPLVSRVIHRIADSSDTDRSLHGRISHESLDNDFDVDCDDGYLYVLGLCHGRDFDPDRAAYCWCATKVDAVWWNSPHELGVNRLTDWHILPWLWSHPSTIQSKQNNNHGNGVSGTRTREIIFFIQRNRSQASFEEEFVVRFLYEISKGLNRNLA